MDLSFDIGSTAKRQKCPHCQSKYLALTRFILDRGEAFAACLIEAHRHHKIPELYFTCTLGSWHEDSSEDHVTFLCRYGDLEGHSEFVCSLLDVPDTFQSSLAGKKLTRKEALKHPKINEFWAVIDFLLLNDMALHDFEHHPLKSRLKNLISS